MFNNNDFSKLKILKICNKDVYIVDRHQYVLPIWASKSISNNENYELVSIDYHPDTNPPFWQKSYLQAVNENLGDDEAYIDQISDMMVGKIDPRDLQSIIIVSDMLNNDEHINTAMKLNYISDYHMINCMDNHIYASGKHYLLKHEFFSSLRDDMFNSIDFKVPNKKFILDVDLDYFLKKNSFLLSKSMDEDEGDSFTYLRELVINSEFITIARSIKYFNYLRKDNFEIEDCEELMLGMIEKILTEK